jgi:hypothetical protein
MPKQVPVPDQDQGRLEPGKWLQRSKRTVGRGLPPPALSARVWQRPCAAAPACGSARDAPGPLTLGGVQGDDFDDEVSFASAR